MKQPKACKEKPKNDWVANFAKQFFFFLVYELALCLLFLLCPQNASRLSPSPFLMTKN
jgi:hypothetical protein